MSDIDFEVHGTERGAKRHYRRGEKACASCRRANSEAKAKRRARDEERRSRGGVNSKTVREGERTVDWDAKTREWLVRLDEREMSA